MTQKEDKKIKLVNKNSVRFPIPEKYGNILLIGNFDGVCGTLQASENGKKYFFTEFSEAVSHNASILIKILQSGKHIYLISTKETDIYFRRLLTIFKDNGFFDKVRKNRVIKQYHWQELDCNKTDSEMTDCLNNKLYNGLNKMKFDIVIQNPPYNGNLHLDFFEKGLDILTETGKMVIIEPATWLIDVRKNRSSKRYNAIKERINGHIESVVIENLNNEFNIVQAVPFAITTIDMSKTFNTINYICCGEHKTVDSVYDCNLIGEYNTIWGIFEKVLVFEDMMKNHMTNENKGEEYWYAKCVGKGKDSLISGSGSALCASTTKRIGLSYDTDTMWCKTENGEHINPYTTVCYHYYQNEISNTPLCSYDRGKKITQNIAWCVYGSQTDLENWKHFIFTNKLPLFINICLIFNQHNNSADFLPWLVDKQYTDDEINKLFGFTDEEIKLIDTTIKKYERNSLWFKRYMCGKDAVSDEEVNNFIAEISK